MRHTKMPTKQTNAPQTTRQAFMVLAVSTFSTFLVLFAASCVQVSPTAPVANATPNSQPANPEAYKAEVRKFFDDHGAALVRADTATLDKMWADEIVLIDHEGTPSARRSGATY